MADAPTIPPPPWTEEKVRALTEHSSDIISLLDDQGRLIYNSPAAQRISGFATEELEGLDTFEFIHPDDRAQVAEGFGQVLAAPGATVTIEYRYRHKSGGWTWMEAVASNQLDNPDVRGIVANSRDITERKRAQMERQALEEQLLHRQRLESLGTLAGGIAHDFNNLLSAISLHVALAWMACEDDDVRKELAGAEAAVKHASDLTRQLLGFAHRQPTKPLTLDLAQALERLRPMLERVLGGRVEVSLEAPRVPLWVKLDPAQLEQVVVNLATNARDAMPNGGCVSLNLVQGPADQLRGGQPQALLQVRDDGVGIAPEILPRVFEPFFTTKELGRGTGLGLAVSHGIVVQAGGQISLQSTPGKGTTVSVQLPLTEPAPEPHRSPEELAGSAKPGERVLLADDDDFVRGVTKRMLVKLGWQVDDVRDGLEAVVRMAASPTLYTAAVFDLRMPRMGGEEAARQIRAMVPGLPIIFISGYVEEDLPLDRVVQKPFDGPALGGHLRRAIDAEVGGAA